MSELVQTADQKSKQPILQQPPEMEYENGQYLTFIQQEEMFAIGILGIKEIIEYGNLTTVPLMPKFISGVINIRGAVVPVIDLSARLGREASDKTRRTCIVIIETTNDNEQMDVGIIVDSVSEVLEILPKDIEPSPHFGTNIRSDFISGMGKVNEKFVIILDINRVLSVDEMSSLSAINGEKKPELAMVE